jgi:hypothetical protein
MNSVSHWGGTVAQDRRALRANSGHHGTLPCWPGNWRRWRPPSPSVRVLSRGGWYRLGGVVDTAHERLSDHLETWAEHELAAHDDDMATLCDAYADRGPARHPSDRPHALFCRRHRSRSGRFRADRDRGTAGSDLPSPVRHGNPAVEHRGTGRPAQRGPDLLRRGRTDRRAVPGPAPPDAGGHLPRPHARAEAPTRNRSIVSSRPGKRAAPARRRSFPTTG